MGPSGSGKSTTLRLITRMLDPTEGSVLIDGVDTRDVSLDSLRNRVAVVPQDTSLFDNTVEYNIKYGVSNETVVSDELMAEIVSKCNLDETLRKLPNGLQSQVSRLALHGYYFNILFLSSPTLHKLYYYFTRCNSSHTNISNQSINLYRILSFLPH